MGFLLLATGLFFFSDAAVAQTLPVPAIGTTLNEQGEQIWSLSSETLVVLTLITFIPAALIMMTGFTRIMTVLALLRIALVLAAAHPNRILTVMSLCLTLLAHALVSDYIF